MTSMSSPSLSPSPIFSPPFTSTLNKHPHATFVTRQSTLLSLSRDPFCNYSSNELLTNKKNHNASFSKFLNNFQNHKSKTTISSKTNLLSIFEPKLSTNYSTNFSTNFTTKFKTKFETKFETKTFAWRWDDEEVAAAESDGGVTFEDGVNLFNSGEYYECHDVFEELWNRAREPQRGILHGILQCAVGMYHLSNQNHRGAMVEFGEGVSKLRRLRLVDGPLHEFERSASELLEFIYSTQLEHAACSDDMCVAMDGSEQSYQLLGNFGAGQPLYRFEKDEKGLLHVHFCPQRGDNDFSDDFPQIETPRALVPVLRASEGDLLH